MSRRVLNKSPRRVFAEFGEIPETQDIDFTPLPTLPQEEADHTIPETQPERVNSEPSEENNKNESSDDSDEDYDPGEVNADAADESSGAVPSRQAGREGGELGSDSSAGSAGASGGTGAAGCSASSNAMIPVVHDLSKANPVNLDEYPHVLHLETGTRVVGYRSREAKLANCYFKNKKLLQEELTKHKLNHGDLVKDASFTCARKASGTSPVWRYIYVLTEKQKSENSKKEYHHVCILCLQNPAKSWEDALVALSYNKSKNIFNPSNGKQHYVSTHEQSTQPSKKRKHNMLAAMVSKSRNDNVALAQAALVGLYAPLDYQ